jgi:hypothetical protein
MLNDKKDGLHYGMYIGLVAVILAALWAYHHGLLNWAGFDGFKSVSSTKGKSFAKYVANCANVAANNKQSGQGMLDAPTALPNLAGAES